MQRRELYPPFDFYKKLLYNIIRKRKDDVIC